MEDVTFEIEPIEDSSTIVMVTFSYNGESVRRPVNAVFDTNGNYADTETVERVKEVARGIPHKVQVSTNVAATPSESPTEAPAVASKPKSQGKKNRRK